MSVRRTRIAEAALRAATEHPLVRKAQELFDATVVSVEPDESATDARASADQEEQTGA